MRYFAYLSLQRTGLVAAGALVIIGISLAGITRVRVGSDFTEMFPGDHPIRHSFAMFNDYLGGARYFNIMITGREPGTITNFIFDLSSSN